MTNVVAGDVTGVALGLGRPGEAGSTLSMLYGGGGAFGSSNPLTGTVALNEDAEFWLIGGELYVNIMTAANPAGELRGQLASTVPVLHLPVYAAPRLVAAMAAVSSTIEFGNDAGAPQSIALAGQGLRGTATPTDVLSLVSAVELQLSSPNSRPAKIGDYGADTYDHADLKYVGVTSNYPTQGAAVADSTIYFGVATHGAWSSPNEVEFDFYIDVDGDGNDDYRLFNSNREGYASDYIVSDAFVSVLEELATGEMSVQGPLNGVSPERYDPGLFLSSVMVLPVSAAALGLTNAQPSFNYTVKSFSTDLGYQKEDLVDSTGALFYDVTNAALLLPGGKEGAPLYEDLPGNSIALQLNPAGYAAHPPQGLLLLHHHNAAELKTEVLAVQYSWPFQLFLPIIER